MGYRAMARPTRYSTARRRSHPAPAEHAIARRPLALWLLRRSLVRVRLSPAGRRCAPVPETTWRASLRSRASREPAVGPEPDVSAEKAKFLAVQSERRPKRIKET